MTRGTPAKEPRRRSGSASRVPAEGSPPVATGPSSEVQGAAASVAGTPSLPPAVVAGSSPAETTGGRHRPRRVAVVGAGPSGLFAAQALLNTAPFEVEIDIFDEPDVAAAKHRVGLRRLIALQIKEPLKYLEKNIPDLQKMAMAYMSLGTTDELRDQIIDVALDRAYLNDPLPSDAASFKARVEEGRTRLNLIAQEVARLASTVLTEYAAAARKLKDAKPPKDVADDVAAQLQRLMPKRFVSATPYAQLQHFPRYLKGITLRLDKLKGDPARDAQRMNELRPLDQRLVRRLAELKGTHDARTDEFRWLLEELRISLFAQELRTPQPVSVKRLEKVWAQIGQ